MGGGVASSMVDADKCAGVVSGVAVVAAMA